MLGRPRRGAGRRRGAGPGARGGPGPLDLRLGRRLPGQGAGLVADWLRAGLPDARPTVSPSSLALLLPAPLPPVQPPAPRNHITSLLSPTPSRPWLPISLGITPRASLMTPTCTSVLKALLAFLPSSPRYTALSALSRVRAFALAVAPAWKALPRFPSSFAYVPHSYSFLETPVLSTQAKIASRHPLAFTLP